LAGLFSGIIEHQSTFLIRGIPTCGHCYYNKTNSCWVKFKPDGTHFTHATEAAKERGLVLGNVPESDETFNTTLGVEKKIRTSIFGNVPETDETFNTTLSMLQSDQTLPPYPQIETEEIEYISAAFGEYNICFPKAYNKFGYECIWSG